MKKLVFGFLFICLLIGCGQDGSDGDPGPQGFSALLNVTELASGNTECPQGGSRIDTGIDNGDGTDGIAGNNVLESGEIDSSAVICNGADGNNGSPSGGGFDFFFANFGTDKYDAFTTVSISDRYPDENRITEPFGSGEVICQTDIFVDNSIEPDSVSRVRSLMRFSGLQEFFLTAFPNSEPMLNEAVIYMLMVESPFATPFPSDIDFIPFGPLALDGPIYRGSGDYVPAETTWNQESQGVDWLTPGFFVNSSGFGRDDSDFITNKGFGDGEQWFAFKLDTARVKKWLNFENENKGIFMTVDEEFAINRGTQVDIQIGYKDILLYLNVEPKEVAGGRIRGSAAPEIPWSERSAEQRFKPLYDYLKRQKGGGRD